MSSSKVIKREENPFFQIKLFEVKEIETSQPDGPPGNEDGSVRLPLSTNPATISKKRSKDQDGVEDLDGEETPGEKVARIEREAYEKGFEQGRKDGLELEKKQMEEKGKQLESLFFELRNLKACICSETEAEILKVIMMIAKKVVGEEIKTERGIIRRTIGSALKFLVDKSDMQIRVNPDDMEEIRKIFPHLAAVTRGGQFQLIEDKAIEMGGCILETGFGKINATIGDQLGELEKEIEREFHLKQGEVHETFS
jgi:flagellar assembly protein FliH